jgi:hypothetical protein
MIAAVYLPIWTVPLAAWLALVAWIVWDDHRARVRRRRAR